MKYTEGKIGRIFILKFDHGDHFEDAIGQFCRDENVRVGHIQLLGAVKRSSVVVGPKNDNVPPEPKWHTVNEAKEVVGFGTILWDTEKPRVHLHTIFSRGEKAFIGCVRKETEVFLIVEAVVTEIENVSVSRVYDKKSGFCLMQIDLEKCGEHDEA